MKDFVPKGTGNSRYLRSVSDFITRYPTYEAFAAALVAGKLPVDLAGLNPEGITQMGTPANKATLLKDTTALKFGKTDAVPDDIFAVLGDFLSTSATKIAIGSYVGTGTTGLSGKNRLNFDFSPDVLFVTPASPYYANTGTMIPSNASHMKIPLIAIRGQTDGMFYFIGSGSYPDAATNITFGGNYIEWYNTYSSYDQLNQQNTTYYYVCLGGVS